MTNLYQVLPLEKKSAVFEAEMFRKNEDGTLSWFNVSTTYRFGQGFLEFEECNLPTKDARYVYCALETGWGCEFDDAIATAFEFSDDIDEEEQAEIEDAYYDGWQAWLYDSDHAWEVESDGVQILAPFKVNIVDESSCAVIQDNVELLEPVKVDKTAPGFPFPSGTRS